MKHFSIVLGLIFAVIASPTWAGPPFNVDDPGTTEFKHFAVIAAYISSQSSAGEFQQIPSLQILYGAAKNLEVGITPSVNSVRSAGVGRQTGVGDTNLSARWRFLEETKTRPQILAGYQLKLPTADPARGLGTGCVDHNFWLTAAKSFQRLQVFGNLGYNFLGGNAGVNNCLYGAGVNYQVTDKLILGGAVYGNSLNAPGGKYELAWQGGLTYNFAPDRSLLFSAGRSEQGLSDLNIFAGMSFTFK